MRFCAFVALLLAFGTFVVSATDCHLVLNEKQLWSETETANSSCLVVEGAVHVTDPKLWAVAIERHISIFDNSGHGAAIVQHLSTPVFLVIGGSSKLQAQGLTFVIMDDASYVAGDLFGFVDRIARSISGSVVWTSVTFVLQFSGFASTNSDSMSRAQSWLQGLQQFTSMDLSSSTASQYVLVPLNNISNVSSGGHQLLDCSLLLDYGACSNGQRSNQSGQLPCIASQDFSDGSRNNLLPIVAGVLGGLVALLLAVAFWQLITKRGVSTGAQSKHPRVYGSGAPASLQSSDKLGERQQAGRSPINTSYVYGTIQHLETTSGDTELIETVLPLNQQMPVSKPCDAQGYWFRGDKPGHCNNDDNGMQYEINVCSGSIISAAVREPIPVHRLSTSSRPSTSSARMSIGSTSTTNDSKRCSFEAAAARTLAQGKIEAARDGLNTAVPDCDLINGQLTLGPLLGSGTYGRVYRGYWQGCQVAVKCVTLPGQSTADAGSGKRERMAVMEAAISSASRHPNVVQTYTYSLQPAGQAAKSNSGSNMVMSASGALGAIDEGAVPVAPAEVDSWEVLLVLEYCDMGSLRDLLARDGLRGLDGNVDLHLLYGLALDVSRAMVYLHGQNIVHGDLKARNVLLTSGNAEPGRDITAKVADFGLSQQLSRGQWQLGSSCQGTLSYMAPEVMAQGQVSRASDVYAFGIMVWELYTGQKPYQGLRRAQLYSEVVLTGARPLLPPDIPAGLGDLLLRCWDVDPAQRPSFQEILLHLLQLRSSRSEFDSCEDDTMASSSLAPAADESTCTWSGRLSFSTQDNSPRHRDGLSRVATFASLQDAAPAAAPSPRRAPSNLATATYATPLNPATTRTPPAQPQPSRFSSETTALLRAVAVPAAHDSSRQMQQADDAMAALRRAVNASNQRQRCNSCSSLAVAASAAQQPAFRPRCLSAEHYERPAAAELPGLSLSQQVELLQQDVQHLARRSSSVQQQLHELSVYIEFSSSDADSSGGDGHTLLAEEPTEEQCNRCGYWA